MLALRFPGNEVGALRGHTVQHRVMEKEQGATWFLSAPRSPEAGNSMEEATGEERRLFSTPGFKGSHGSVANAFV